MDWDREVLETLRRSRAAWDEPPNWRAVLELEGAGLNEALLRMIDESYRNLYSSREDQPLDDVQVNLPAGMVAEDLLCIEAAVLAAAERGLGEALFRLNRLMRSPRWHAMYPRLRWLSTQLLDVQRRLADTTAGRTLAAMLGLAVGDALGVTLEFQERSRIRREHPGGFREIEGGGPFGFAKGDWTDDTAMALAVAEGVAEAPADPVAAVGLRFMAWYESHPPDVGNTCRFALQTFKETGSWPQTTDMIERRLGKNAGGNGALMRTLPTALAYGSDPTQALRIARMTHPHAESDAAVAAYHAMVDALVHRKASKAEALAAGTAAAGPLAPLLRKAPALKEAEVRSGGYVVETLEAAVWSFMTTDSLEECIVTAVGLGADTDTTGAVAGGLAGAYYGLFAIPRRWTTVLRGRERIEEAAAGLYRVKETAGNRAGFGE